MKVEPSISTGFQHIWKLYVGHLKPTFATDLLRQVGSEKIDNAADLTVKPLTWETVEFGANADASFRVFVRFVSVYALRHYLCLLLNSPM